MISITRVVNLYKIKRQQICVSAAFVFFPENRQETLKRNNCAPIEI